jgi:photosystem II stability/assembly factor-like uncharacterized protein
VETLVHLKRLMTLGAALAASALAACDKDPAAPTGVLTLTCPTGNLAINASIALNFSLPLRASTVSPANIVVTNAATGIEIPGALILSATGAQVLFAPSSQLPFGTVLGIRAQNLVSADGSVPMSVVVCNVLTEPPPIAEVVWTLLDSPTGTDLSSASLFAPDSGWVSSLAVPMYRRVGTGWEVRFNQPYFVRTYDVRFVSAQHGYGAHLDQRQGRSVITQSRDGGVNFDTIFTRVGRDVRRLWIDSVNSNNTLFGVAGGGSATSAMLLKMNPANSTFTEVFTMGSTSSVGDISFAKNDTTTGFAVSSGAFFLSTPPIVLPGRLFRTTNGGSSWAEVPNSQADTVNVIVYRGVARRASGDVFVTGGNGFVGRFAGGNAPVEKINLGIVSRDTSVYTALIYNDVEFAPDNDLYGWIVGAQLIGIENGVPRYQGLIFRTRDGGATWVRQGVVGAEDYGALFPPLNRLVVYSSTEAWAVGDAGTVISLNP